MSSGSTKTQGATLLVWGKRELLSCWVDHKRIPRGASLMKCHGYREITLLAGGATTLGINPPNLPILKVVVLPIKVFSFTKPFLHSSIGKNLPASKKTLVWFLGWEDPLEKGKATHSSILLWRIPWTIVHKVTKSWTQLSHFHFHFPLKLFKYLLNYLNNYTSQNWSPLASSSTQNF